MRRFYWDFYGGQAAGTAAHFRVHLDEFVVNRELGECPSGTEAYSPSHHAAWCAASDKASEVIVTHLRPHRAESVSKTE
jgi:uncharacterized protein